MKVWRTTIKEGVSWKKHPGFLIIAGLLLLGYVAFLSSFPMLTIATNLNYLIYAFLFFLISQFLYYIAYRWVLPEIQQMPFHQTYQLFSTSLMVSMGIGIWFYQNRTIIPAVEKIINQIAGRTLFKNDIAIYPVLTFFFLLLALTPILWGVLQLLFKKFNIKGKNTSKQLQLCAYIFLLISITTCIFTTDFLEISPGQQSQIYFGGTEDYVRYRIRDVDTSLIEDLQIHGGFLYGRGPNPDDPVRDYLSVTGFYGTLMKVIQATTNIDPELLIVNSRILLGFFTASILTAISLVLKKHFGLLSSLTFSSLSAITYWFIGPSTHLLWFFPVMFLPLLLGIFLYPRVVHGKISMKRFLTWVFVAQIFAFLHSYVYAPVMLLSAAVPPFFYNLKQRMKFKDILWNGFSICLVGLLAMGLVMAVHIIQLSLYFDSVEEAFLYFANRTEERGVTTIKHADSVSQVFRNWMNKVKVFYFSKRLTGILWWEIDVSNDWVNFGTFHFATAGMIGIAGLYKLLVLMGVVKAKEKQAEIHTLFLFAIATIAATLSSWSWFPALGHMSDHYHMNGIMYMILMGIFVFGLAGILLHTSIHLLVTIGHAPKQ